MAKKILRFICREEYFVPLLIFLAILAATVPLLFLLFNTPKDTFFSFAHNYIPDYYQYISHMKDGADGKLLMTFRSSPDNFVRKPVYLFYTVAGFIISFFRVDNFIGYTFLRIIFSFVKLAAIYFLICSLFKQSDLRKTAFFLTVFSAPFFGFQPLRILFPAITSIDPLVRILFLPHDLATISFLILGSIFFNRWLETKNLSFKLLFFACLFFILATIANPTTLALFYLFLGGAVFLTLIRKEADFNRMVLGLIIIGATTLPLIIYYQRLFSSTLPFLLIYVRQKATNFNINLKDFIFTCGPTFFLSLPAVPYFFQKKGFLAKLILAWAILPTLLFSFLGKTIPLSQERIFESSQYIPLAVMAAITIYQLGTKWLKTTIIALYLVFVIVSCYLSVKFQIDSHFGPYLNIYVPLPTIQAFNWLDKNTPDESVVAAGYFAGNMLPAFSHNKVLFGHDYSTYQPELRWKEEMTILNREAKPGEIEAVLDREKVSYILFSPDSPSFDQTNLGSLKNIQLVFTNGQNSIYRYLKVN